MKFITLFIKLWLAFAMVTAALLAFFILWPVQVVLEMLRVLKGKA